MRLFKNVFVLAFLLFAVGIISCEREKEISVDNRVSDLTKEALSSAKFRDLDVSIESLDVEASQFINADKKSILIPFSGYDDRKGVIALFNDNYRLITVAAYEAITNTPADLVYSELKNGSFTGTFVFQAENSKVAVDLKNSRITSSRISSGNTAGRSESCNGMTETGGALDCAGERLVNMNWFDSALCYASFIPCMAQLTVSCAIDGCVN